MIKYSEKGKCKFLCVGSNNQVSWIRICIPLPSTLLLVIARRQHKYSSTREQLNILTKYSILCSSKKKKAIGILNIMICKNVCINLGAKKQVEGIIQIVGSYFFFYSWVFPCIFIHTHTPYFLYPFFYQWTLRLFSCLGYWKLCWVNMGVQISLQKSDFFTFG